MIVPTIVVLGLISVSSASQCCFPREYEAFQGLMRATLKNGQFTTLFGTLRMVFNGTAKMAYFDENLIDNGVNMNVKVLQDYPNRKKYVISNGVCKEEALTEFRDGCVPDSAGLLTKATFGNNALNANVYNTSSTGQASFLLTEQQNCYPIMMVSSLPTGAAPNMQIVVFMNVTAKISDPSVFNVTKSCPQPTIVG